uniref:L-serine-phosphatidylethanolamine phosphatidyltransferase n=1 Tax=Brugia timori TaxID=42155 RepID=A0A0R3QDS5_9BILA
LVLTDCQRRLHDVFRWWIICWLTVFSMPSYFIMRWYEWWRLGKF